MCYYKGNIQDLLVIPVLSSTINHQTPSGSIFHLILFCQIMLRNIWNHNIFEVYHFKRAYLLLWVLSTISFKARIWDFLRNENAPHQMLFSKVVHSANLNFLSTNTQTELLFSSGTITQIIFKTAIVKIPLLAFNF